MQTTNQIDCQWDAMLFLWVLNVLLQSANKMLDRSPGYIEGYVSQFSGWCNPARKAHPVSRITGNLSGTALSKEHEAESGFLKVQLL